MTHLFYRFKDEPIYSPKGLGLYYSLESVRKAVEYFNTQPGFCDNQDAYSVRARDVVGDIANDFVFEVLVHIHSEDYEFETAIELGLYGVCPSFFGLWHRDVIIEQIGSYCPKISERMCVD